MKRKENKPTLQEVKKHFKYAKKVQFCNSKTIAKLTTRNIGYNDAGGINELKNDNKYLITKGDYHCLWSPERGYAKIVSYNKKHSSKTKLSQLEKQFSDLAKDVSELRQTLAKDVEVDVEEVKSELIVGKLSVNRWYKNDLSTMDSIFYATEHHNEIKYFSGYGFEKNKTSKEFTFIELKKEYWADINLSEATPQEVQRALENFLQKELLSI